MSAAATPYALAADQLVLDIGTAYSRLSPRSHADLSTYMAGDRSIPQAYDVALQILATTSQEDLALILARLLVMADDQVGG